LPGGVVVAQRTLTPSTQVRILAGQPLITKEFGVRLILAIICLISIFFIPTSIALFRDSSKKWGIFLVNILVGWTGIGWIVALIWAFVSESNKEKNLRLNSYKN
tara:strand:- start:138 stop:449 length:312 start_codon:yes stop_codon:yes gene_type:complete